MCVVAAVCTVYVCIPVPWLGSEGLQLAKAAQLPDLIAEKMAELDHARAQLCRLQKEHGEKTITKHKVALTCAW